MSEIKLESRYPESRHEDITDAFMHGYVVALEASAAEMGSRECRMDYLCDGYLYLKSYWCRTCDERFAYRNICDKEATPKYCPNCGCEVKA